MGYNMPYKYLKMGFRSSFPNEISMEGFEDVSGTRQSEVWKHFLLNKALEKARCKHCTDMFIAITSTMNRHLKLKHGIEVKSVRTDAPFAPIKPQSHLGHP